MEDETLEIKSESPTETEETTQEKIDTTTENENITADTPEQVTEVLQTKGFDYAELQKEFVDTGEISADTRKKLSDVGITDELIDNYIDGQLAKAEQERNEISTCVGGRENFDNIVKWASENLTTEEIISINSVTDKGIIQIILKDLKTRMEEKEGIIPSYTKGESVKAQTEIYR